MVYMFHYSVYRIPIGMYIDNARKNRKSLTGGHDIHVHLRFFYNYYNTSAGYYDFFGVVLE